VRSRNDSKAAKLPNPKSEKPGRVPDVEAMLLTGHPDPQLPNELITGWLISRAFPTVPYPISAGGKTRRADSFRPHGSGEASDTLLPVARCPSQGYSSWLYPFPRPCNNSIASTGLHPTSTTIFAMCFTGRSMCNVCRTFKTIILCGLLNI